MAPVEVEEEEEKGEPRVRKSRSRRRRRWKPRLGVRPALPAHCVPDTQRGCRGLLSPLFGGRRRRPRFRFRLQGKAIPQADNVGLGGMGVRAV